MRRVEPADGPGAPKAVVVSDAMGKVLWPGKDPIGKCIRLNADTTPCIYVVGIAENIRTRCTNASFGAAFHAPRTRRRDADCNDRDGRATLL